jgi:hypothetical protein
MTSNDAGDPAQAHRHHHDGGHCHHHDGGPLEGVTVNDLARPADAFRAIPQYWREFDKITFDIFSDLPAIHIPSSRFGVIFYNNLTAKSNPMCGLNPSVDVHTNILERKQDRNSSHMARARHIVNQLRSCPNHGIGEASPFFRAAFAAFLSNLPHACAPRSLINGHRQGRGSDAGWVRLIEAGRICLAWRRKTAEHGG